MIVGWWSSCKWSNHVYMVFSFLLSVRACRCIDVSKYVLVHLAQQIFFTQIHRSRKKSFYSAKKKITFFCSKITSKSSLKRFGKRIWNFTPEQVGELESLHLYLISNFFQKKKKKRTSSSTIFIIFGIHYVEMPKILFGNWPSTNFK